MSDKDGRFLRSRFSLNRKKSSNRGQSATKDRKPTVRFDNECTTHATSHFGRAQNPSNSASKPRPTSPRLLKVKIVTWNMHDSVPDSNGRLDDLLGSTHSLPQYVQRPPEDQEDSFKIPGLSATDQHPYHIIAVAGQECPREFRIPSLWHRKDKESNQDKQKNGAGKQDNGNREASPTSAGVIVDRLVVDEPCTCMSEANGSSDANEQLPEDKADDDDQSPQKGGRRRPSSWTALLKHHLCYTNNTSPDWNDSDVEFQFPISPDADRRSSSAVSEDDQSAILGGNNGDQMNKGQSDVRSEKSNESNEKRRSRKDSLPLSSNTAHYILLEKVRLLGIYMAIFIHKDLESDVRGCSKASVPCGLIGGRWGNKGGVGISVNLDGTTLLFLNSHLTAHPDEQHEAERIKNMEKIKSELKVKDYLEEDDPRKHENDLTNRFDYSFFFGDLNFRLGSEVDWAKALQMITKRNYQEALSYDQLFVLMQKTEHTFSGFKEHKVNFPPTYKYDVPRNPKREMTNPFRRRRLESQSNANLFGVNQINCEATDALDIQRCSSPEAEEVASSRSGIRSTDNLQSLPLSSSGRQFTSSTPPEVRVRVEDAAECTQRGARLDQSRQAIQTVIPVLKAKKTWLSLLSLSLSRSTLDIQQGGRLQGFRNRMKSVSLANLQSGSRRKSSVSSIFRKSFGRSGSSSKSVNAIPYEGVYAKERVPSWCDRILFKSTVIPSEEPEHELPTARNIIKRMFSQISRSRLPSEVSLSDAEEAVRRVNEGKSLDISEMKRRAATAPSSPTLRIGSGPNEEEGFDLESRAEDQGLGTEEPHLPPRRPLNLRLPSTRMRRSRTVESNLSELAQSPSSTTGRRRPSFSFWRPSLSRASSPTRARVSPRAIDDKIEEEDYSDDGQRPQVAISEGTFGGLGLSNWRFFPKSGSSSTSASAFPSRRGSLVNPLQQVVRKAKRKRRPKRGEIVTLHYGTLDDQAMARLGGRSDHRPVLGTYAIYV